MRTLLFVFAVSAGIPLLAQKPSAKRAFPVQLSTRLNAATPAEAGQRLSAPFSDGSAHPAGVNTCAELLLVANKIDGDGPDAQARRSTLADCLVLKELSQASAARSSFVADLKWDERVLPMLPAELAINVSDEAIRGARGKVWVDLDKTATAAETGPDQIVVKGKAFTERLIIWGRADFNHDGRQDLLVQTLDTLTEGTYRNTRLFILTRKSPKARLTVVRELL